MPYKNLKLSHLGLEKDFVLFIEKYEKQYTSIYESSSNASSSSADSNSTSTKKKKKRLFDKFFFSMD